MQTDLIIVEEYCLHCRIDPDFVLLLDKTGLVEIQHIDNIAYIHKSQLSDLERYTHLYYDLDINIEGIDAIHHLLHRMEKMQQEINQLKNRVHFHLNNRYLFEKE